MKKMKHAKEKGSRLERKVAERIRAKGLDKKAKRMPLSGAFPHLRADIYTNLGVHIECKNRERIDFWRWWEQTAAKADFGRQPVVIIKSNNRPIVAVIDFEYLLNLWKIEQESLRSIDNVR